MVSTEKIADYIPAKFNCLKLKGLSRPARLLRCSIVLRATDCNAATGVQHTHPVADRFHARPDEEKKRVVVGPMSMIPN